MNPQCRYFQTGHCRHGDQCRYSHDDMSYSGRQQHRSSYSRPAPDSDRYRWSATQNYQSPMSQIPSRSLSPRRNNAGTSLQSFSFATAPAPSSYGTTPPGLNRFPPFSPNRNVAMHENRVTMAREPPYTRAQNYTEMSETSAADKKEFSSSGAFSIGMIPRKPPPVQFCH